MFKEEDKIKIQKKLSEIGLQMNIEKTKIYNSWDNAKFEFAGIEMTTKARANQAAKTTN